MKTSGALEIGEHFADRFEIVSLLASGRRGNTYVARDEEGGREVALLHVGVLLTERQKRALDQTRFLLRGAMHSGLALIDALGIVNERPWFATPLLYGVSLEKALAASGAIPMRRAAMLVSQVARALAVPHASRLWHRSLKPSNLFLVGGPSSDTIVVLDLGVGAVLCSDGRSIATPQLAAPEESLDTVVDGRSDIYTLGAVLFEMLTGRPPFAGSIAELRSAHRLQPPPLLRALKPSAQPLEQIVNRMLAKRPDDRPQTMIEVAEALDEILAAPAASLEIDASDPTPDPPSSPDQRTWSFSERPTPTASSVVAPTSASRAEAPLTAKSAGQGASASTPMIPRIPWWLLVALPILAGFIGWWAGRQ